MTMWCCLHETDVGEYLNAELFYHLNQLQNSESDHLVITATVKALN